MGTTPLVIMPFSGHLASIEGAREVELAAGVSALAHRLEAGRLARHDTASAR